MKGAAPSAMLPVLKTGDSSLSWSYHVQVLQGFLL